MAWCSRAVTPLRSPTLPAATRNVTPGATLNMILGNPQIVVRGNTATLDALWTGVLNIDLKTPPRLLQQGTDHAELVKTDGRWRIRHRVIRSLSNMPQAWDGD